MTRFHKAMAAPASLPEFKGTVIAVPTTPFWDDKVAALGMKQLKIQRMRRLIFRKSPDRPNADGKMKQADIKTYMDDYNTKIFSPEDLEFKKRTGTGGFVHYYGSAKFHIQAGQAFAKALLGLER